MRKFYNRKNRINTTSPESTKSQKYMSVIAQENRLLAKNIGYLQLVPLSAYIHTSSNL